MGRGGIGKEREGKGKGRKGKGRDGGRKGKGKVKVRGGIGREDKEREERQDFKEGVRIGLERADIESNKGGN